MPSEFGPTSPAHGSPRRNGSEHGMNFGEALPETLPHAEPSLSSSGAKEIILGGVCCPRLIGDYEILDLLGAGGMGNVFLAKNQFFGRKDALKMIHDRLESRAAREAFISEMHVQSQLDHANIVKVLYAGIDRQPGRFKNQVYLVMSLEKTDLAEAIKENGPYSPLEAARLVRRLAKALVHAHGKKVIHCDLKPKNIMLGEDGTPRISDFGLVKLLAAGGETPGEGQPFGTPCYMPPEQARGERSKANPRNDIYGLGSILYELLTGRPPYTGNTRDEVMAKVKDLSVMPPLPHTINPKVPARLEAICMKCLQKYPAARYTTARELEHDLTSFLRVPLLRRRWRELAIAGLVTALVFTVAGLAWELSPSPRAEATEATRNAQALELDGRFDEAIKRYQDAEATLRSIDSASVVLDRSKIRGALAELEQKRTDLKIRKSQHELDALDADARAERGRAEEARRHGDAKAEFTSLIEARQRYAALIAQEGHTVQSRSDYARLLARIAEIHEGNRDSAEAIKTLDRAVEILKSLPSDDPARLLAEAEVDHIYGVHHQNQGLYLAARKKYEEGRDRRLKLVEMGRHDTPQFRRDLSRSYAYLADVLLLTEASPTAAEDNYRRAEQLRAALARDHGEIECHCLHARDFANVAEIEEVKSQWEKVIDSRRKKVEYYEKHVSAPTLPAAYLTERADAYVELAESQLFSEAQPPQKISEWLEKAKSEYDVLSADGDYSDTVAVALARLSVVKGRYLLRAGKPAEARSALEHASKNYQRLDDQEKCQPADFYQMAVAHTLLTTLPSTEGDRLHHHHLALDRLEKAIRKNYLRRARIQNDSALKTLWDSHPRRLARIVKELDQRLSDLRARK